MTFKPTFCVFSSAEWRYQRGRPTRWLDHIVVEFERQRGAQRQYVILAEEDFNKLLERANVVTEVIEDMEKTKRVQRAWAYQNIDVSPMEVRASQNFYNMLTNWIARLRRMA